MRLEQHDEAAAREPLPRRRDGGRDLRRMMRVVIDDQHAAGLAEHLEASAHAAEARDSPHGIGRIEACDARGCNRQERVAHVEFARRVQLHPKADARPRDGEIRARARRRDAFGRPLSMRGVASERRGREPDVGPFRRRAFGRRAPAAGGRVVDQSAPLAQRQRVLQERVPQRPEIAVVVEVVGLKVGDHRDFGLVVVERPPVLVRFQHQPIVRPAPRVGRDSGHFRAEHVACVATARPHRAGQHRRRGRFAVRPRDRDHAAPRGHFPQQFRPREHVQPGPLGRGDLWVIGGDRDRADHARRAGGMRRVVPDLDLGAARAQLFDQPRVGAVAAAHGLAVVEQDVRQRAHVDAADPGEVDAVHLRTSISCRAIADAPSWSRCSMARARISASRPRSSSSPVTVPNRSRSTSSFSTITAAPA